MGRNDLEQFRQEIEAMIQDGRYSDEDIRKVLDDGNCMTRKPWPAGEIPDAVLRILYWISEPVNREVLADMDAHGKAYHWLESLRICSYRVKHRECSGKPADNINERACVIYMKRRARQLGLLE